MGAVGGSTDGGKQILFFLMNTELPRLWIVGAGGFGREVWTYATTHPDCGRQWQVAGFLDDNQHALAGFPGYSATLQRIEEFHPDPEKDILVNGIGQPKIKRRCIGMLEEKGGRFIRLIHPTAWIGHNVTWGKGGVVGPGVVITTDVTIGDHVVLNCYSAIGHDAAVGSYTTLSSFCDVTGGVRIGEGVFTGSRVSLIPRVSVGDYAVVGAGSVVIRNLDGGCSYFGNPARRL